MVYETYETESFVLSGKNLGEGDRLFRLFTKDFGLVQAYAKSVRVENSKLRYHLQPFSHSYVAVVRGKEYWRIVGVKDAEHFFLKLKDCPEKSEALRRVFNLLERLLAGQEQNGKLFSVITTFVEYVSSSGKISPEYLRRAEILSVARILHALGYLSKETYMKEFFEHEVLSEEILDMLAQSEKELLSSVNNALRESQL